MNAKSASTTLTTAANQAAPLGSAMAELLTQVPGPLAEQIQNAFTDDLLFIFQVGMDAGQQNAWDALEKEGITDRPAVSAMSKPHLTLVSGGAS